MKKILTLILLLTIISCSHMTPQDYQDNTPTLDIKQYLNGRLTAWGTLENRSGKITRRFVVDMTGTWQGNTGTLEEHFTFDDGEKSERIWKITFSDAHHFTATAADVIGQATGSQYGNAVQMQYVLDLPVGKSKKYKVKLDDWMYLMDDNILLNKSTIRKFGITWAKLTIFFQKLDQPKS